MKKIRAKVIEDNGGGLHLYVFDAQDNVIYAHSGYEYEGNNLVEDIDNLISSGSVDGWDGCDENPQEEYAEIMKNEYGYENVANIIYGTCYLHTERMGVAAKLAFGVEI